VLNRHDIPLALPAPSPTAGARSSHRPQTKGQGFTKCSPTAGSDNSMPEKAAIAVPLGILPFGDQLTPVYPHFSDRILAGLKHRHDVAFPKRSHLAGPRSKRAFIGGSRRGFEGVTPRLPEDGCHLDGRGGLVGAICCQPTWTCETSLPAHMDGPNGARPGGRGARRSFPALSC
jgi:hypothetical protein